MCIGIPMKIIGYQGELAICEGSGRQQTVDMMLLGKMEIGCWVLVFLDTAREILSEEQAAQITDALQAVNLAMQGEYSVEHLFADLVGREPQLPSFLSDTA